ncbi:MAG TPA: hypothetical protein DCK95_01770 [Anaerolineaceae bacterium]|nr:hypothetical protein [Anaerolineaceae bacterium]
MHGLIVDRFLKRFSGSRGLRRKNAARMEEDQQLENERRGVSEQGLPVKNEAEGKEDKGTATEKD